jgi:hypothetical protein
LKSISYQLSAISYQLSAIRTLEGPALGAGLSCIWWVVAGRGP